jgi:hypothetical protein
MMGAKRVRSSFLFPRKKVASLVSVKKSLGQVSESPELTGLCSHGNACTYGHRWARTRWLITWTDLNIWLH